MTLRPILPLIGLVALLAACAPDPGRTPTLVVENARVIVGDGTVLERASVVVSGERIVSVTDEPVEAPDARRIDASGKTVLPGLIDAHTHLIVPPGRPDSTSWARYLDEGVAGALRHFLDHGVTTVVSTGDIWPEVGDLRDRVAAGELPGPRIVTAGPVFTSKGGHPVSNFLRDCRFCRREAREVTEPQQAREAVRELAEEGVDFIKVISDSLIVPVQIEDAVVAAIIDQAHREGLRAVAHAAEADFMEAYAEMGVDGFVHMPEENVSVYDPRQLARALVQYGTPVTTTLSLNLLYIDRPVGPILEGTSPRPEEVQVRSEHVAILAEAGVPIVVGTDWTAYSGSLKDHPAVEPGALTVTEMMVLEWGGMSRESILQAATLNAAKALEMSDRIGTLEPGKLADLIVVNGNPMEHLSALREVEVVVKGGEVVSARRPNRAPAGSASGGKKEAGSRPQEWPREQETLWERDGEWRIIAGMSGPGDGTEDQVPGKEGGKR